MLDGHLIDLVKLDGLNLVVKLVTLYLDLFVLCEG